MPRTADVLIRQEGTLVLMFPQTEAARHWFAEHIPAAATYWGKALVVEPRYTRDILDGMAHEGLLITTEVP